MEIRKRLHLLGSDCLLKKQEAAVRADQIRAEIECLTVSADLFRDDPKELAPWQFLSDEYKRLWSLAAKEQAEARRWATRYSYANQGLLLLGLDERSRGDIYPPELQEAAIAAGVAYVTSEWDGPPGDYPSWMSEDRFPGPLTPPATCLGGGSGAAR
jgi:hypothetical protein